MPIFWIAMSLLAGGLVLLIATNDAGSVFGMESGAFAGVLYLGVIALVIGTGLVSRRTSMGSNVKTIAAWLVILLVLVGGYQYRYELQDVASRLTAGFVPGSPVSVMSADGEATVRLEKLSDGHFGARAEVDGVTVDFLVDTGATTTVLSAADAGRVGIDVDALNFAIPVSTANGIARAARATVDEVRVGSISRSRLPVLVAAPGTLSQSLLGMNFIGSLSGFDVRRDLLILRD
ncbi:TIGR02281 family clan AA aspartic protease [Aquibium sp. LZ166]|uniref:TIGR02281 family clan AA aspartic protease n=1 Tax=Aquibium pacificus TaxID=3153579 RepID=A0ABV3SR22_9HYPH